MCAAFASRVCAALPFALVLTLAAFSQLPGRSESTIALLQNAAYPDVADAAATFGPRIPRAGLTGTLFLAAPLEGCAPLAKHPGGPWIALMERSEPSADCGFITKVRHAEAAGAIAAVVYDYVEGPLIPMARPDDDQAPDAGIPSVFVTASGGRVLRAALSGPLGGALITLRAPQTFGDWPSLLAGAFVACLVASAALSATCGGGGPGGNDGDDAEAAEARRRRRDRERLLTAAQIVAATETCVFSSADASIGADGDTTGDGSTNGDGSAETGTCGAANNGTRTTCTVCLEEYEDGDRLRVLACEHAFHEACIDPWLRTKRACCPFCKADVRPPPKKRRGRRGRSANANEGANANERGANDVDAEAGGAAADADDDDLAAPLLRRAEERPSHEEEGEAAAEGGRRRRRWGLRAMRDVLGSVVRPLARRGPRGGPRAAASDDDDDGAGREDAVVDLEAGEAEAGAGASDA